jgi:hypothetical protein
VARTMLILREIPLESKGYWLADSLDDQHGPILSVFGARRRSYVIA